MKRKLQAYGRNDPDYRRRLKGEDTKPEEEEKKEKDENLNNHPLHVGKARKDEPKITQPIGAAMGIVPELNFRLLLTGPSNSGKTNFARWIIDKYYRSAFHRLVLMSPTAGIDPVWKDLKGLKKSDRIEKLKIKPLQKLLKTQESLVKKKGKTNAQKVLLVLDDTIGNTSFIGSPEFLQVFIRGRHFNISSVVMTQSYVKLPRSVRLQATHVAMFPSFRSEIERLYEEHGPYQLNKKQWFSMVMQACQKTKEETHPFFYLDTTKAVEERYRRCLYQILPVDPNANPTLDDKTLNKRKEFEGEQGDKLEQEMKLPERKRFKTK